MCGRFSLKADIEYVLDEFDIDEKGSTGVIPSDIYLPSYMDHLTPFDFDGYTPRYNIAPTDRVSAVVMGPGLPILTSFRWGLVPEWSTGPKDPRVGGLINARAETLREKPSFKGPLAGRRCLIVADGFYEWKKDGSKRIPYNIRLRSERPFGLAGLFDVWRGGEPEAITSCVIITCGPNEVVSDIHDRMPVIIPTELRQAWLDPRLDTFRVLEQMLAPYPGDLMEAFQVPDTINTVGVDGPELIEPVRTVSLDDFF